MADSRSIDAKAVVASVKLEVEVDCEQLRCDLEWAHTHFMTHQNRKHFGKTADKLAEVQNMSLKLKQMIEDEQVREILGLRLLPSEILQVLQDIADAAHPSELQPDTAAEKINSLLIDEMGVDRRSPFEWLVGERLADIFEKHFLQPAGFTRDPYINKVDSAYIRFVQAALGQLNIKNNGAPYSASSIARALTDGKVGRSRKKARPS
jgi:hypothetical protein